jgi:hypothetical protein
MHAGATRNARVSSDPKRSAMALPPWRTSRTSSAASRGPRRPSSRAPCRPRGQRRIPARTRVTTASPNWPSSSAQTRASPGSIRPMEAAVSDTERPRAMARPPGNGWAAGSTGWRNRSPKAPRSRPVMAGATMARGRKPAPRSWRKPGRVHSSVRAEPPTSWLASTRQTDQPTSASRKAAASPLGPPPATTASKSAMTFRYPPAARTSDRQRGTSR